ncbi:PREDICTED: seed trypsin/chymotrypsin inhibitor TI5-72-like [Lupinus angustifolius]|uniref:seed trypsin/chymotrypsin inhibitor TI5-72-like n=1 Tax=Lupinus angustifolius TaxID=3871 RepID=UPI00092FA764|nr:PREDICTED: seed trypsin/chymotrypsin inhibitor TI5-72-like [Lupinus angustifolius]
MELKKKVIVMKVAMLVFLMGSFTAIVEARFNPSSIITQLLMNDNTVTATMQYFSNSLSSKPCCDSCICNSCICTRSFPPQFRCSDITNFCYKPCTSSEVLVH